MARLKPKLACRLNRNHALSRDLVFFPLFSEGSGLTVFDLSGKQDAGELNVNLSWVYGPYGPAVSWPGTGDYPITFAHSPSLDMGTSDFTIIIRFKPNSAGILLQKCSNISTGNAGYGIYLTTDSQGYARINDGVTDKYELFNCTANAWNYLVATFDRDGLLQVWVNLVDEGTEDISGVGDVDNANTLRMGNVRAGTNYNGLIDVPLIYKRLLSSSEIARPYWDPFCMVLPKRRILSDVVAAAAAARRSRVGFKPIRGADRLRGLRRIA